ncbi:MAG: SHOCT domain-containing protein [Chloroflexota bacterium]|nr:SHOCT domain-containing protein [Chloroflexota bacterium]
MRGFGRGPFFGGIPTWQWALGLSLHWLGTLAFWGAVIVGIILVVRWLGGERREGQTPQEILKRRYASGEITGEQYEQMRRALES